MKTNTSRDQSGPGSLQWPQSSDHRRGRRRRSDGSRGGMWWRMKRNIKQSTGDRLCWSCFLISRLNKYESAQAPPLPPCIQTDTRPHRSTYAHCRHLLRMPLRSWTHASVASYQITAWGPGPGRLKFRRRAIQRGIYMYNMQLFISERRIRVRNASLWKYLQLKWWRQRTLQFCKPDRFTYSFCRDKLWGWI